jgi:hypothetical protein
MIETSPCKRLSYTRRLAVATFGGIITLVTVAGSKDLLSQTEMKPVVVANGCTAQAGRVARLVSGEVQAGQSFERSMERFVFRLTPQLQAGGPPMGWRIGIFEPARKEDLSGFTPPFHGPNPLQVFAWHFRNSDNTGPNDSSTNAPGLHREFIFHPEVGRTIFYEDDAKRMLANLDIIENFGRGTFNVLDLRLTEPRKGESPGIIWLRFEACLTWPSNAADAR